MSLISSACAFIDYRCGDWVYGEKLQYFDIYFNDIISKCKVRCLVIDNKYYVSDDYIRETFAFEHSYQGGVKTPFYKSYQIFSLMPSFILAARCGEAYTRINIGFSYGDKYQNSINVNGYCSYNDYRGYADIEHFSNIMGYTLLISEEQKTITILSTN